VSRPPSLSLAAAGNPLDTPANIGKLATAEVPAGTDKLEAEGLQSGLDWYGTNENSAALFFATHLSSSESEGDDDAADEEGSDAEAHSGGDAAPGSGGADDASLPRHMQARLVEQEAYIAELEDQNLRWVLRGFPCRLGAEPSMLLPYVGLFVYDLVLFLLLALRRLREQLEMLQQEMDDLRGHGHDSEEGYAEHSEGSLPGDLSVMQQQP
jgi:hypothetical protein